MGHDGAHGPKRQSEPQLEHSKSFMRGIVRVDHGESSAMAVRSRRMSRGICGPLGQLTSRDSFDSPGTSTTSRKGDAPAGDESTYLV